MSALETAAGLRVIYIVGSGHSGSTVLDALLGSHPDMVGVGELSHFFREEWMAEQYCSCGARLDACEFWSGVTRRVGEALGAERTRALLGLVRSVERIRRIPSLRASGFRRRVFFDDYARASTAVLRAIMDVSGRSVIVDSSKNPARMLALSTIPGLDLRVIHLVRDGRAVAFSYRKSSRKQPAMGFGKTRASQAVWQSALMWRFTNVVSEFAARRMARPSTFLRYEDFVVDCAASFRQLAERLEIDLGPVVEKIGTGSPIEFDHRLAGNPVRMNRGVKLKLDQEWTSALTESERSQFWGLAGPTARRYGYEKNAGR